VLAVVLGLFFSLRGGRAGNDAGTVVQLQTRVNPNDASVASLVRLPQIGKLRAEKIIAYRQSRRGDEPAFKCVDDLRKVKGIGPAVAAGLSEYLTFDSEN
jgi:DNA uptake protein ComE-like DNA-binding protein